MSGKYLLLLGAGFSRNWDGWLANEVFEYLLGAAKVSRSATLVALLWKHRRKGFEAALSEVQTQAKRKNATAEWVQHLDDLQSAIREMFEHMNHAYEQRVAFEFDNEAQHSIRRFLTQFDAIYTLNQDLLLETHYMGGDIISLRSGGRWVSCDMPGVRRLPSSGPTARRQKWEVGETGVIKNRVQPYFKLHGSSRWRDKDGNQLLIMGGNKSFAIQTHPLLRWYHEQFADDLRKRGAKLMVIGYGFGDRHINETIISGRESGLKVFVVDPLGAEAAASKGVRHQNSPPNEIQQMLIGASRRPLRRTFSGDEIELLKLMNFFDF